MEFDFKLVKINDWSHYESGKSNDGGCYLFTVTYEPIGYAFFGNDMLMMFKVQYYSSSIFPYCNNNGGFGDKDAEYPHLIDENELYAIIKMAEKDENATIEYIKKEVLV